jgi:hypothetical protein
LNISGHEDFSEDSSAWRQTVFLLRVLCEHGEDERTLDQLENIRFSTTTTMHGDNIFRSTEFKILYEWKLIVKCKYTDSLTVINKTVLFLESALLALLIRNKSCRLT